MLSLDKWQDVYMSWRAPFFPPYDGAGGTERASGRMERRPHSHYRARARSSGTIGIPKQEGRKESWEGGSESESGVHGLFFSSLSLFLPRN